MYAHVSNFIFFTTFLSPAYLSQLSKRFFGGEQQTLAVFFPPTGEYKSCRSRKFLKNENKVAKIGVDAAESEPSENVDLKVGTRT